MSTHSIKFENELHQPFCLYQKTLSKRFIRLTLTLLIGVIYSTSPLAAQDFSSYMKDSRYTCDEIELNFKREIVRFYGERQFDSVYVLAYNWKKKCFRTVNGFIGLAIAEVLTNKPTTLDKDTTHSRQILLIQGMKNQKLELYTDQQADAFIDTVTTPVQVNEIDVSYKEWIVKVADSLTKYLPPNTIEHQFMKLLSQNAYNIFEGADQNQLTNGKHLFQFRNEMVKELLKEPEYMIMIRGGLSLPDNKLSKFGPKGNFICHFGQKLKRHHFLGSLGFQFLNHRDTIPFNMKGTDYFSKSYATLLLGVNYQYEFLRTKNSVFYFTGGYSISGVNFYRRDAPDDYDKAVEFNNHTLGTGIGMYFYSSALVIWGIELQQQYTYIRKNDVTHFQGYPLLLTISYGFSTRNHTRDILKQLNYTKPN